MDYNIERFVLAQDGDTDALPPIANAYRELSCSHKTTHWIWYVFPNFVGLGKSDNSQHFAIRNLDEAREYIRHPILRLRMYNLCKTLLVFKNKPLSFKVPDSIDREKIMSCMTLFDYISPGDVFQDVLDAFFNGEKHKKTLQLIKDSHV